MYYENLFRGTSEYRKALPNIVRKGLSELDLRWVSDYYDRISPPIYAQLRETEISDEDIAILMNWHHGWVYLSFYNSSLSNEQAEKLSTLSRLEFLDFEWTQLHGDGLCAFAESKNLKWLRVGGLNITDSDMQLVVENHRELAVLILRKTKVTNKTISLLGGLPRLRGVDFSCCDSITPDVEAFRKLPPLAYIHLDARLATPAIVNVLKVASPAIVIHIENCSPVDDTDSEIDELNQIGPGF